MKPWSKRIRAMLPLLTCGIGVLVGAAMLLNLQRTQPKIEDVRLGRISQRYRREEVDVEWLTGALRSYADRYGQLPFEASSPIDINRSEAILVLLGHTNNDERVSRRNPEGIKFLHIPDSSVSGGQWLDPWGQPYRFLYTPNTDDQEPSVLIDVQSNGPNGVNENGLGDDRVFRTTLTLQQ